MARITALLLGIFLISFNGRTTHVLGGDITWKCQGGDYVFELVFYRDCNGADISTVSANIDVWNHPTLNQITLNYISREDLSPICSSVAGGPSQLNCGNGPNGGTGLGAIEKIIYRSLPIAIPGTPPAEGWIFTFQNFSRSGAITNLQNPSTYGITLASTIYAVPNGTSGCVDNSPIFLQDPYFIACTSDPYEYNMNVIDADLDSLSISFGQPMDHYQLNPYNPPINPTEIPFEPGFSTFSPTPGIGLNASNIPAQINPNSGNLTFLSNNAGSFVIKVVVQSFRQGILIAEIEREMEVIVTSCTGANTAPSITGPFGGLFETTVFAGDVVNFNLIAADNENLQDGSPQSNFMTITGLEVGPNATLSSGCAIGPCATLDALPPIAMSQGVSTTFNWQTTCDHLVDPSGTTALSVPYQFVFKVQDDYCPVPKVSYATVTINLENPDVIPATSINCIQTSPNGEVTISWNGSINVNNSFVEYQIYSAQNGLITSISDINTTTFTSPSNGQAEDFSIVVSSGCYGNTLRPSDTLSNIHLTLNNPGNGTAILQWNSPSIPALNGMNDYYHIYREYPAGTWNLYDSVPYGSVAYIDTISICSVDLSYQIVLPATPCDFTSNIVGDNFEDLITPDIPNISSVTIDTATNEVHITWNQNQQPDTYGYIIYELDATGIVVPIDTVWGITNTTYTDVTNTTNSSVTYTVAAFDSCTTSTLPITFQTSAKALLNTTAFLTSSLDICAKEITLSWVEYVGWTGIDFYEIYGYKNGGPWITFGSTNSSSFSISVDEASSYCFVVKSVASDGNYSFSNRSCSYVDLPGQPQFNYLQLATVNGEDIQLTHYLDISGNISEVSIQRKDDTGSFVELDRVSALSNTIYFTDSDVDVQEQSYEYRVQIIDSCGQLGAISNIAKTILLTIQNDEVAKINYLNWNAYQEFNGAILGYNIYRGIDGLFESAPLAVVAASQRFYEDDVNDVISSGKICYSVEAIETTNIFNFSELSRSNDACIVLPPIVYIPNSFSPNQDEFNNEFIPVISDFDPTVYEFIVYNRWGRQLFATNNPTVGWNGMVRGTDQMAANDTYLYTVTLIDGNGIEIFKRGHVNLIK
jgi:gliding motility-associated-like protein